MASSANPRNDDEDDRLPRVLQLSAMRLRPPAEQMEQAPADRAGGGRLSPVGRLSVLATDGRA